MSIQVFKFGGASICDPKRMNNVTEIIGRRRAASPHDGLIVVVSAIGKTTNALEQMLRSWKSGDDWRGDLQNIHDTHSHMAEALVGEGHPIHESLETCIVNVRNFLEGAEGVSYSNAFIYDQIVSQGEVLSAWLLSAACDKAGMAHRLLDAGQWLRTDTTYQRAGVNWPDTTRNVDSILKPCLNDGFVLTQGFIGQDRLGYHTTLGREGSDYTAAVVAHGINAAGMTVWKDVPGVQSGDPHYFVSTVHLPSITYGCMGMMARWGASVLHPHTIKPLEDKGIPLEVRSFLHPDCPGTRIEAGLVQENASWRTVLLNQTVVEISARAGTCAETQIRNELMLGNFPVHLDCQTENGNRILSFTNRNGRLPLQEDGVCLLGENLELVTAFGTSLSVNDIQESRKIVLGNIQNGSLTHMVVRPI